MIDELDTYYFVKQKILRTDELRYQGKISLLKNNYILSQKMTLLQETNLHEHFVLFERILSRLGTLR